MNCQHIKHIWGGGRNFEHSKSNNGPNKKKQRLVTQKSPLLSLDSLFQYKHKNILSDQPGTLYVSKNLLSLNVIDPDKLGEREKKIWKLLHIIHPELSEGGGITLFSEFLHSLIFYHQQALQTLSVVVCSKQALLNSCQENSD